ncbi:MAG: hypothetical protein J5I98_18935 [Phaeodactylibacter sp.]|nr:hypothetical protein [Phaeodactylibacter sp.]
MKAICFFIFCLSSVSITSAQPGRWQWGIGTSVHLSSPELQVAPAATSEMVLRPGLSALARYRLNRKANWQWGPLRNRLNLFWEAGLRADGLAYSYDTGKEVICRDYISLEAPVHLVLVSDVRGFPWWRKRRMHGYGRLGAAFGLVVPREIREMAADLSEEASIGGVRAALHLSSGLLRKMSNGSHSSVGVFARIGLTAVVQGQLSTPRQEPAIPFRSNGSLFGLEWSYFFGRGFTGKDRLPEEPADMILCPRF